jgi:hypothetical protein
MTMCVEAWSRVLTFYRSFPEEVSVVIIIIIMKGRKSEVFLVAS